MLILDQCFCSLSVLLLCFWAFLEGGEVVMKLQSPYFPSSLKNKEPSPVIGHKAVQVSGALAPSGCGPQGGSQAQLTTEQSPHSLRKGTHHSLTTTYLTVISSGVNFPRTSIFVNTNQNLHNELMTNVSWYYLLCDKHYKAFSSLSCVSVLPM